jgi:phage/plasmid-like protein (TIGR03299 family)
MKQQFLEQSGTNWTVSKRPLFDEESNFSEHYGIFRDDTNRCLGVVSPRYEIFQNEEALDLLLEASSAVGLELKSGGILEEGKKVYYQFPLQSTPIGNSENVRFLSVLTSHDGSSPIGFGATHVTVSCRNTFYTALSGISKVRHTKNFREKLNELVNNFRVALISEQRVTENLLEMSGVYIPVERISDEFLAYIVGGDPETTKTKNKMDALKASIITETDFHGPSKYGVFNGITRYTTHVINHTDAQDKKESLIKGTGFKVNKRGYEILLNENVAEFDGLMSI